MKDKSKKDDPTGMQEVFDAMYSGDPDTLVNGALYFGDKMWIRSDGSLCAEEDLW